MRIDRGGTPPRNDVERRKILHRNSVLPTPSARLVGYIGEVALIAGAISSIASPMTASLVTFLPEQESNITGVNL